MCIITPSPPPPHYTITDRRLVRFIGFVVSSTCVRRKPVFSCLMSFLCAHSTHSISPRRPCLLMATPPGTTSPGKGPNAQDGGTRHDPNQRLALGMGMKNFMDSMHADTLLQMSQFGAGALAGLVNTLVLSPLDVVKTRLQAQTLGTTNGYRGLSDTLVRMLRNEGVKSWYRGLSASLCAFVPNWAIYWYCYERFKRLYAGNSKRPMPYVHVLSAVSAGGITAVSTAPFWTLKSRLQVDMAKGGERKYRGVVQGLTRIVRDEGFGGLYKGLTPTLLGLGHVGIQFPLYEEIKRRLKGNGEMRALDVLIASSISKIVASAVFYPHEVLRTRIQIDTSVAKTGLEPWKMTSMMRQIVKKDGIKGFYRGFGTNLMRTVPACMLTFTSYELAKRFAENQNWGKTDLVEADEEGLVEGERRECR